MIKWLKRLFIPHVANAYRPNFLLAHNIRHLIAVVFGLELVLFVVPFLSFAGLFDAVNLSAVLPGVLSSLTNDERAKYDLPALSVSEALSRAAQMKAEDMASKGYFAHVSPEGVPPWHWIELSGYSYSFAGENLAVNFADSRDVTEAWMNSPTHRANMIAGYYTEVGTGMARGIYKGEEAIFVAQMYASPRARTASALPAPSSPALLQTEALTQAPREGEQVLGEAVAEPLASAEEPSFIDRAASSPRHTMNTVLYVMLAFALVALFLNIAIKFEYQHPDLILNGTALAVIVFGLFLMNGFISQKDVETTFTAFETASSRE